MNILYLTTTDPRKKSFGAEQRSHHLWNALKEFGEVDTVVPCCHPKDEFEKDGIRHLCIEKRWGMRFFIDRLLIRLFHIRLPFYANRRTRERICRGKKYDIVVARYTSTAAYFKAWDIAPLLLDVDDLPVQLSATIFEPEQGRLMRKLTRRVTQWWSDWVFSKCACAWVANPEQKGEVCSRTVLDLGNIPMPPREGFDFKKKPENFLMTVGYMAHQPNHQGVDRFIEEYWHKILAKFPRMEYRIIGKGCPKEYAKKWARIPGVRVLGYVEDIETEYERCLATVAPIYSGAGTCIKTLESVVRGRPCIASEFGLRGVDAEGLGGLVWPLNDDVAETVGKIIESGDGVRGKVVGRYTFEEFKRQAKAGIDACINGGGAGGGEPSGRERGGDSGVRTKGEAE